MIRAAAGNLFIMTEQLKRRNYFIDKPVQSRFIARFALISVLGAVVSVVVFRYFAQMKIEKVIYSMRLPAAAMADLFTREMLLTGAVGALFVVIFFFITAKMIFSRIYGPLKKMAASVKDIAEGRLNTEIQLREKDEFQPFAADLNDMLMSLRRRFGRIKDCSDKLVILTEQDSGRDNLAALDRLLTELDKEVRYFKV